LDGATRTALARFQHTFKADTHLLLSDHLPPERAAERAAHHLGQAIDLVDRYDHGAEGAYRVLVGGSSWVFKYWSGEQTAALRLPNAVAAHQVLRRCGWPLPAIRFWRSEPRFAFVLEEQMQGSRVDVVPEALCRQLLALLAAVPPGASGVPSDSLWVAMLEQSLYQDLPLSPCRPLALEQTASGQRLLAHARQAFRTARPALVAARDIIHGDFSAGNILCDGTGALAAVLDWQHAEVGHRGYDLIGLEWDLALRLDVGSANLLALVTAQADQHIEESVRTFCRAYYGVWNLSWALDTQYEAAVLHAASAVGVV
jgi:hypothetical protein